MAPAATAAESLLKSGQVSSMIRQGFIVSPSSSPPPPPTAAGGGNGAAIRRSLPSPPPTSSFPSPKSASLFEMIAQEDLSRRPPPPPPSSIEKLRLLHDSVSVALAREGPGDVQLAVSSADGTRVSVAAHHRVLSARSRFFAEKLAGVGGATPGRPVAVEICECDDVEAYLEAVGLMYSVDFRRRLAGEKVDKILGLLKIVMQVSVDIMFDDGISSCLDYLDMMPWSETEEEKVISVLGKLQLQPHEPIGGILQRVSVEPSNSSYSHSIFFRIMASILQAKDKKARREMKFLIAGLLKEDQNKSVTNENKLEVSRDALYHFWHKCVASLAFLLTEAANIDEGSKDRAAVMSEVAREADNIQWLAEILIDKRLADEFVAHWADQSELASLHSKIPCMYRHEISRITAQLCIAIGRGQILVSKDTRILLLRTWLEGLYEDFGWMRRTSRTFDKKMIEDGLCATILTLPMAHQEEILLRWLNCFLNKGDDCPNIQRAFEVWWRRAFVRQYAGDLDQLQLHILPCRSPT